MEQILNRLVIGISILFRFDYENDPRGSRKKSLIILLAFILFLNALAVWTILQPR
ncbi:hypothetical protein G7062_06170 [Erysipelothrix sp. HDW6C]|uniref:hypothetical protein n=1 Tax=Erysipelothrix sp. HDW6C TaxID=2714930 RepID=UPI00140C68BC|nr:hypothetical protein [Erysipelothrix sp. HDW6C]QIK69902.1 hypothetical protein G7062_06170 [Erysipelothrix sp. HDW6C]